MSLDIINKIHELFEIVLIALLPIGILTHLLSPKKEKDRKLARRLHLCTLLCLVIGSISTIVIWRTGETIDHVKNEQIKELRIGISEAESISSIVQAELSSAQDQISVLRKNRPRMINKSQEKAFIDWLNTNRGTFIDIAFPLGNDECRNLAVQFHDAFKKAKWSPNIKKISYRSSQPEGILVAIHKETDLAENVAKSLYYLLDEIGFHPTLQYDTFVEEEKVLLIIGTKEQNELIGN